MSSSASSAPIGINPRVDCVFKAILGDPSHKDVLLDFLNAVLHPSYRLVDVTILNPQHAPQRLTGPASVLDIKAMDTSGTMLQVDMQTWGVTAMRSRMVFHNAELFVRQGQRNQDYSKLCPAISIWLLDQNLLRDGKTFHHRFRLTDPEAGKARQGRKGGGRMDGLLCLRRDLERHPPAPLLSLAGARHGCPQAVPGQRRVVQRLFLPG